MVVLPNVYGERKQKPSCERVKEKFSVCIKGLIVHYNGFFEIIGKVEVIGDCKITNLIYG